MKRLADQKLQIHGGRTLVADLLAAGEFPLALGAVHRTLEQQRRGVPVDNVPFRTPALAALRCIGIHKHAPHPNAAKVLVNFMLSKEGQSTIKRQERVPVRPDIQLDPALEALKRNQFPIGPKDPELLHRYRKEYEETFLKRSF
jgi:iron(III) transport system substrate-binding protein